MVPRLCPVQFGDARWSLGGPGWSPGAARGLPGGYRAIMNVSESLGKGVFCPLAPRGMGSANLGFLFLDAATAGNVHMALCAAAKVR